MSTNTFFATDGGMGVKLARTLASATFSPEFGLGTVVTGNNGSRWMYVKASGAITQYDAVGITSAFLASSITKALADAGDTPGYAQVAFNDADYGWVALEGRAGLKVNTLTGTSANVALYTTATAGALSSTSSSQTQIRGVTATTANASGITTPEPILANQGFTV